MSLKRPFVPKRDVKQLLPGYFFIKDKDKYLVFFTKTMYVLIKSQLKNIFQMALILKIISFYPQKLLC